ncbi:type II toxin-antitoxin system RelE family toxin [Methanosarcina sp.]|uniref:type II toxin-antitoxin system RelE family toxin n=1 Tax=Methanosarcina sp. TaxID=2213 RepID=UPI003C7311BA
MAAYTIDFKASVEKDLKKVPKDRLPDILEKIEELAEVPLPSDSKNCPALNIGIVFGWEITG